MPKEESLHAWFSETSAQQNGAALWTSTLDQEVRVTEVRSVQTPVSLWPDAQYIGRVRSFIAVDPPARARRR